MTSRPYKMRCNGRTFRTLARTKGEARAIFKDLLQKWERRIGGSARLRAKVRVDRQAMNGE
jgi:hypothetical protein